MSQFFSSPLKGHLTSLVPKRVNEGRRTMREEKDRDREKKHFPAVGLQRRCHLLSGIRVIGVIRGSKLSSPLVNL